MVRTLTFEDRKKIEKMWEDNTPHVKIAAELEIGQCTVYTELKRGQTTDKWTGEVRLVEYALVLGLIKVESTFRTDAVSCVGCWPDAA